MRRENDEDSFVQLSGGSHPLQDKRIMKRRYYGGDQNY